MSLSVKQISVAEDLVSGEFSKVAVAEKNEISRTTLYEWLRNPEFVELLNELSKLSIESTRIAIKASTDKAYNELNKLLNSKSERIRLMASSTLLDRAGLSSEMSIKMGVTTEKPIERLTPEEIRKSLQQKKNLLQLEGKVE